jgi:hypothetical protein
MMYGFKRLLATALTAGAVVGSALAMSAGTAQATAGNPFGAVDSVGVVFGSNGNAVGVSARGWGADPDTPGLPIDVRVTANGNNIGTTNAGGSRPDVAAAFPGYGPNHGYYGEFPLSLVAANINVCVVGINYLSGSDTVLGCKTVNHSVDMNQACRYTYNNPNAFATSPFGGNAFSWSCRVTVLSVPAGATFNNLGGVDVQKYCSTTYPGSRAVVVNPNSDGGWRCQ